MDAFLFEVRESFRRSVVDRRFGESVMDPSYTPRDDESEVGHSELGSSEYANSELATSTPGFQGSIYLDATEYS
jgi:hypothetical protein